jgi:hypothetical protein
LEQSRGAAYRNVAAVLRNCEDWLRQRPPGTKLVEVAAVEVSDILKQSERQFDGVERLRLPLRELDADRHRINNAPYPSADAKRKAHDQIVALAERGMPSVDELIEHDGNIGWPQATVSLPLVAIVGETGHRLIGNAQGEVFDSLGAFCWLNKAVLLKNLDALIDAEADDGHALSQGDRSTKLAEIERDRLVIERQEAALVWAAQAQGDSVEHRADASVLAVLGIALAA